MSQVGRATLALVAAAVVLVAMAWFDTTVVRGAQDRAGHMFDYSQIALIWPFGILASTGAVLLLAWLAWHSGSVVVGVIYALVGAFFVFSLWILVNLAAVRNNVPPVLPESLDWTVNHIVLWSVGPLRAVGIIGGGMLISGVAVIARSVRGRTGSSVPR